MVERGQALGMTGRLQSIQWAAIFGATILTGALGGFLSQHGWQRASFLICALVTGPTIFMAWFYVDESHSVRPPGTLRGNLALLWNTARSPTLLAICLFLFLLNFNPFASTIRYLRMTDDLGWSEQFAGNCTSWRSVACVVGAVAYGLYCRRLSIPLLIHLGIATNLASILAYLAMTSEAAAVVISLATGFTYITTTLVQLDLAARLCPPAVAGTTFALLMAISNFALSSSLWAGGHLSDRLRQNWSSTTTFNLSARFAPRRAGSWCRSSGASPAAPRRPGREDGRRPGTRTPAPALTATAVVSAIAESEGSSYTVQDCRCGFLPTLPLARRF
jgi:predicted MFS family arabinose efflux permease